MQYRKSSYLNIYTAGNKNIIFHSYYGNIMKINHAVKDILDFFEEPHSLEDCLQTYAREDADNVKTLLQACIDKQYLVESIHPTEELRKIQEDIRLNYYPERLLRFYLTSNCNMACKYCFEGNHTAGAEMTVKTIEDSTDAFIDFLCKDASLGTTELIKINYFGGEPLIRFDLIKESLGYIKSRFDEFKNPYKVTINTNGTLFTDEIIDFIIQNHIHVYLSIDGLENQNDRNRVFKNGKGTFSTVIGNLKKIVGRVDEEYLERYLTILVTISNDNLKNVSELVEYLEDMKIKNISLNAAFNCALSSDQTNWTLLSDEEVDTFIEEVIRLRDRMYSRNVHIGGMWGYIPNRLKEGGYDFCQAVGHEIGISATGELYACPCTFGMENEKIGNISGKHFQFNQNYDRWRMRKVIHTKQCDLCKISGICRGGCPGVSILKKKDIYEPQQCVFWEKFVKAYVTKAF